MPNKEFESLPYRPKRESPPSRYSEISLPNEEGEYEICDAFGNVEKKRVITSKQAEKLREIKKQRNELTAIEWLEEIAKTDAVRVRQEAQQITQEKLRKEWSHLSPVQLHKKYGEILEEETQKLAEAVIKNLKEKEGI